MVNTIEKMKQGRRMGSISESEEIAVLSTVAQGRTYKKSDIRGGKDGWG